MNKVEIITLAEKFIEGSPQNYITEEIALHPGCEGLKIFEPPIFAFGSPDDELYLRYKDPDVIGNHFLSPDEWLPTARTVISFFLPYTEKIKTANATDCLWPANEWIHGRHEGQQLINLLLEYLAKTISEAGFETLAPSLDCRYKTGNEKPKIKYTSNWSERHVAYACGMGTFGLSKGLITKKGMCGRLGSILTELDLPKDNREYNDICEYCNMCGMCINRCPVQAISFNEGKKSSLCSGFLDKVRGKHSRMYGCGKCQVGVPCESKVPQSV